MSQRDRAILAVALFGMGLAACKGTGRISSGLRFDAEAHRLLYSFAEANLKSPFTEEPTQEQMDAYEKTLSTWLDQFIRDHAENTNVFTAQLIRAEVVADGPMGYDKAAQALETLTAPNGSAAGHWQQFYAHWLLARNTYSRAVMRKHPDEHGVRKAVRYILDRLEFFRRLDNEEDPDLMVVHGWQRPLERPWNANAKPSRFSADILDSVGYWLQDQAERLDDRWFGISQEAKAIFKGVIHDYPDTDAAQQAAFHLRRIKEHQEFVRQWETWAHAQGEDPGALSAEERKRSRAAWRQDPQAREESKRQWEEWKRRQKEESKENNNR